MKRSTQSLAVLGLSALSLVALAPASRAAAVAPSFGDYTEKYTLAPFVFNPSVVSGSADALIFTFGAHNVSGTLGGTPVYDANFSSSDAAALVADNFAYSGNWIVDQTGLEIGALEGADRGHFGYTSGNNQLQSATLYNNGQNTNIFGGVTSPSDGKKTPLPTTTSIYIPFSSVGTSATFDIGYYDDPTLSDFLLQEQYTDPNGGTVTKDLIKGTFSGTAFTPAGPGTPAVPESSSLALLGLGVLPLLGIARRRATRA